MISSTVSGRTGDGVRERRPGNDRPRQKSGADVDVHWVIAQGNLVAHGHVHADGKTFTQKDQHGSKPWKDGPAQVSGVTVTVALEPRPAQLDASGWHQEVQLKVT